MERSRDLIFLGDSGEFVIDARMIYAAQFDNSTTTITVYFQKYKAEIEYDDGNEYHDDKVMIKTLLEEMHCG